MQAFEIDFEMLRRQEKLLYFYIWNLKVNFDEIVLLTNVVL